MILPDNFNDERPVRPVDIARWKIIGQGRGFLPRIVSATGGDATLPTGEEIEAVPASHLEGAVEALEHIANHGQARPLPPFEDHGEPCRRPPEDCAADALDRIRGQSDTTGIHAQNTGDSPS